MKSAIYKIYTYYLLLIISFPVLASSSNENERSLQAINPPIKIGQIVAENDFLYRKIIEITSDHHYKVQNFYKQTNGKQSDIFIIKEIKNLSIFQELPIYNLQNLIFEGPLTLWSINGNIAMKFDVNNGNVEGLFIKYYAITGNKEVEGYYHVGKPDGLWKYWSEDNDLQKQIYFKHGTIQWQRDSFQINGF